MEREEVLIDQVEKSERLGRVYCTMKGAAKVLRVRENRMSRMLHKEELNAIKVGWQWLIHRDELERLGKVVEPEEVEVYVR